MLLMRGMSMSAVGRTARMSSKNVDMSLRPKQATQHRSDRDPYEGDSGREAATLACPSHSPMDALPH